MKAEIRNWDSGVNLVVENVVQVPLFLRLFGHSRCLLPLEGMSFCSRKCTQMLETWVTSHKTVKFSYIYQRLTITLTKQGKPWIFHEPHSQKTQMLTHCLLPCLPGIVSFKRISSTFTHIHHERFRWPPVVVWALCLLWQVAFVDGWGRSSRQPLWSGFFSSGKMDARKWGNEGSDEWFLFCSTERLVNFHDFASRIFWNHCQH